MPPRTDAAVAIDRVAIGPLGPRQRHRQEKDVGRNEEDRAFDESDECQPPFGRLPGRERQGPVVKFAQQWLPRRFLGAPCLERFAASHNATGTPRRNGGSGQLTRGGAPYSPLPFLPAPGRGPCGGIGRRGRLKICCLHGRAGSIPARGTIFLISPKRSKSADSKLSTVRLQPNVLLDEWAEAG